MGTAASDPASARGPSALALVRLLRGSAARQALQMQQAAAALLAANVGRRVVTRPGAAADRVGAAAVCCVAAGGAAGVRVLGPGWGEAGRRAYLANGGRGPGRTCRSAAGRHFSCRGCGFSGMHARLRKGSGGTGSGEK